MDLLARIKAERERFIHKHGRVPSTGEDAQICEQQERSIKEEQERAKAATAEAYRNAKG